MLEKKIIKKNYNLQHTCLSVRFRLRASSHLFCFETYALKRNSFSSSNVWYLEYGLRFLRTLTCPVHSRGLFGVQEPTDPTPTVKLDAIKKIKNY